MSIELSVFTRSRKARELGIDNSLPEPPNPHPALVLFEDFRSKILTPLCDRYSGVGITSGYRCPELNTAVGGSATSDHVWDAFGIAADFDLAKPHSLRECFDWLRRDSNLPFDQCILERDKATGEDKCIHISYRPSPRRMAGLGGTHGSMKYEWLPVGPEDA